MIWQYILTALSCALFFGFVVLCVKKFGLRSCYSAYGPLWAAIPPFTFTFNPWSIVTLVTAFILVPVTIEVAEGSSWQFLGFLCPALLLFVALTPDYGTNKVAGVVHVVCAGLAALMSVLYILLVTPNLWWIIVVVVALATAASLYTGFKAHWDFWFEMAAYVGIYTTVFLAI